jgi:hypothetical protein
LTACVMNKIKRAYSFQEEMYVFCVYVHIRKIQTCFKTPEKILHEGTEKNG